MISFRYYVVTLVAVFLALAVGILMGTTLLDPGLVNDLNRRVTDLKKTVNDYQLEISDQEARLATLNKLVSATLPQLVQGRLVAEPVVMVVDSTVDPSALDGARKAFLGAGASYVGVLSVQPKMSLPDQASRTQIAQILGVGSSTAPADLIAGAARALGARLNQTPVPGDTQDMINRLIDARFLQAAEFPRGDVQAVGGPGVAVVVVSGGADPPAVDPGAFCLPLVGALVDAQQPVVAAEPMKTAASFVSLIRDDGALDGQMITVDDFDQVAGQVAMVFGLANLVANPGRGGDYGVKDGVPLLPAS